MRRIEDHSRARGRRFPLLPDTIFLANLYPRAQQHVISDEALQYALAYCLANTKKRPLHHILVDKSNPLGPDLLSQRQKALEKLVPRRFDDVDLYEWDCDYQGRLMKVPSRVHLEWLCWGYTPDEKGIWECANNELEDKLSGVL
jgi:hypothetical protein